MGTNEIAYQRLAPGFAVSNPEPGQWGPVVIFCTRCGATREELVGGKRS